MKHLPPSSNSSDEDYPWTQAKIYQPPFDKPLVDRDGTPSSLGVAMPPRINWEQVEDFRARGKTSLYPYTDEFFRECQRETENEDIEERTPLTLEELKEVEADRPCPRCFDDGYNLWLRGKVTGIITQRRVQCPCEVIKSINLSFHNMVPQRYWGAKLASLETVEFPTTSLLPVGTQREIITLLRKNPTGSYLFCGGTRRGKTHFSISLLHYALEQWATALFHDPRLWENPVFRMDTEECLTQHVEWATKKPGQRIELPFITVEKIRRLAKLGHRICIFMDEIDKFSPTRFKMATLFKLLNAVSEVHGQIVCVSNAQYDKLRELWGDYDDTAAAILSRISFEGENGAVIDFGK